MAVLGASDLTGCDSIPNFIATGSRMVFEQTGAPTSWTKETSAAFNNVALQVITGTVTNGGGSPFTSVFPTVAKGVSAVPLVGPANLTVNNPPGAILAVQASPEGAGAAYNNVFITVDRMRSHSHTYVPRGSALVGRGSATSLTAPDLTFTPAGTTSNSGSGDSHNHTITGTHGPGNHPVSPGQHTHTVNAANHTHSFTMTARDFDVNYMDVIICTKDP
jgi:hypothetical protein